MFRGEGGERCCFVRHYSQALVSKGDVESISAILYFILFDRHPMSKNIESK